MVSCEQYHKDGLAQLKLSWLTNAAQRTQNKRSMFSAKIRANGIEVSYCKGKPKLSPVIKPLSHRVFIAITCQNNFCGTFLYDLKMDIKSRTHRDGGNTTE